MNKKVLEHVETEKLLMEVEYEIIKATVKARQKNNLSQRDLSAITKIAQPAIANIEKRKNSPQINTLLKILTPLGFTLKVVPIKK